MRRVGEICFFVPVLAVVFLACVPVANAQEAIIVSENELSKLVPTNFYFEGQLGPTQMRNSAAVRFGEKQHIVAALVDTSGYASNIRSKYEGFVISDVKFVLTYSLTGGGMGSATSVDLPAGAYGFGFTDDLKINIFDVGGKKLHTISVVKDEKLQSPRPLAITKSGNDIRLYRGRTYTVIAAK
jgi:hypothetical protein